MAQCINISPAEFENLKKQQKIRLIDIRSQAEHDRDTIPNGECIAPQDLLTTKLNPDELVVVHCQSGNRTRLAELIFAQLNVDKVYIIEGGLIAWKHYMDLD